MEKETVDGVRERKAFPAFSLNQSLVVPGQSIHKIHISQTIRRTI
jgi:hypothetical protein